MTKAIGGFLGFFYFGEKIILVRISYSREQDETWFVAGSSWLKVTPWGIRQAINWASRQFNQPDIYITENGFSDLLSNLDDLQR